MAGTLRLTPAEEKKVETLKLLTKQNTNSGAIKEVINNYEELNNRYLLEIKKREKAEKQFSELKSKVALYFSTLQDINNMINDGKM